MAKHCSPSPFKVLETDASECVLFLSPSLFFIYMHGKSYFYICETLPGSHLYFHAGRNWEILLHTRQGWGEDQENVSVSLTEHLVVVVLFLFPAKPQITLKFEKVPQVHARKEGWK